MAVPYGIVSDCLKRGEVIPFLGAGCSLSGRPPNRAWDENADFLPLGSELSHRLADEAGFPSNEASDRDDLSKVASYYQESIDRPGLLARLRAVFSKKYRFGAIHRFLADLPRPLLIVTTNYDDLIEQAFRDRGKKYHLVVHATEQKEYAASVLWWKPDADEPEHHHPSKLPLSLDAGPQGTTIIYKMHGSVSRQKANWDSFVITEEDYVDFLSRMTGQMPIPKRFIVEFRKRRFLFLGYGLRDWNLRVILKNMKTSLSSLASDPGGQALAAAGGGEGLRSWAIQFRPSELEQALWKARKVNIYDMDIDQFVAKMDELMKPPAKSVAGAL